MKYDYEKQRYIEYTKLSNGQTAVIAFEKFDDEYNIDYWVVFGIAAKKKMLTGWINETNYGELDTETTGKCGMEGLIWAYRKIEEFINDHELIFARRSASKRVRICVCASDRRRYRIYRHFLKRLGFVEQNHPDYKWIIVREFGKKS